MVIDNGSLDPGFGCGLVLRSLLIFNLKAVRFGKLLFDSWRKDLSIRFRYFSVTYDSNLKS